MRTDIVNSMPCRLHHSSSLSLDRRTRSCADLETSQTSWGLGQWMKAIEPYAAAIDCESKWAHRSSFLASA